MNRRGTFRGLMSGMLAAVLFFTPALPVRAVEATEEVLEIWELTELTDPETAAETEPPAQTQPSPIYAPNNIGELQQVPWGVEGLTVSGTVVFLHGDQAVVQDASGGIRVSFLEVPSAAPGDILQLTGKRTGGLQVWEWTKTGRAEVLPEVDATLLEAPENLRVSVVAARVTADSLTQEGFTMALSGRLPRGMVPGNPARVTGVILDGCFYADTIVPIATPEETAAPQKEYHPYFGLLHAHTDLSDGVGTVEEAFQYASQVEGLDFFAVTDHSNSFDKADEIHITDDAEALSADWKATLEAARSVTDANFVGLYGYEMTWQETTDKGHISTFRTTGWQTRDQEGMDTLAGYFAALEQVPEAVSQFNHPGTAYGEFGNFENYSAGYDAVMHLMEVFDEGYPHLDESYYIKALDKGWHLAPTASQNNHNGRWGEENDVRTVILAEELTADSLYDAMHSRRVYATEDRDLSVLYYVNHKVMGSILGPSKALTITASLSDPTDSQIGTVEVVVNGGQVIRSEAVPENQRELTLEEIPADYDYYYLRIVQPDGDIAVTAPVWVEQYSNMGIAEFSCPVRKITEDQPVELTLRLYNHEEVSFLVESLELTANGVALEPIQNPGTARPVYGLEVGIPFVWDTPGQVALTLTVKGIVAGAEREYTHHLTVRCQSKTIIPAETILEVRSGSAGTSYQFTGRLTSANDNPYTTFPGQFYLQDSTAGIAVVGQLESVLEVGEEIEVTGILQENGGNLELELTDWELTGARLEQHRPQRIDLKSLENHRYYGGSLLEIEGEVVSLSRVSGSSAVSRFTLRDSSGNRATVLIEDEIRSGAHGVNTLATKVKKGRRVSVIGLLHVDEYGTPVLRLRNCDEVRYIPSLADLTNPDTGDWLARLEALLRKWLP